MELAAGRSLFARFAHGDSNTATGYEATFAEILEDAVQVMRRRQDRLCGVTRLHTPSTPEPLIVLVVDELAAPTGRVTDRTVNKRIETALGLLLSQGRAVGVVVVGAVQDPRKDVLPMRDLFPNRTALRLDEAEQVNLVLGPGWCVGVRRSSGRCRTPTGRRWRRCWTVRGLSARTIADQLGHARISMTQDIDLGRRVVDETASAALEGFTAGRDETPPPALAVVV